MALGNVIAVALASSAMTLLAAWAFYTIWARRRLEARLALLQVEFEASVKRGVLAAGEELLPRFREQVALGFSDVLQKSRFAGMLGLVKK